MGTILKLEKDWADVKELLKEANPDLNDDDLDYTAGKEDELVKRLAMKMERSTEHIKAWIEIVSHNDGIAY